MDALLTQRGPTLTEVVSTLVGRFRCDDVVAVGNAATRLSDGIPGIIALDDECPTRAPTGPMGLRDLLPQFSDNTLFVLSGNGLDPEYTSTSLYMLPRGKGVLLIQLGESNGPGNALDLADQLLLWDPAHRIGHLDIDGKPWLLVRPRRRVHVTLLMERYSHTYGKSGPSINWDNLVASLAQTGLASSSTVLYDEHFHEGQRYARSEFAPPPDVDEHAVICIFDHANDCNPPLDLLRDIKASGARLAYLWLDTRILRPDPSYPAIADLNIVLDATEFDLPRAWPAFTPKNPAFFHDPGRDNPEWERPIDFSVLGEMRFLRQRKDLIPRLEREQRLSIFAPGSSATDTGRRLSTEEYARIYQQSKISLVLSKDRVRQLKGRIFEVPLCGALMLADVNPYIDRYFEPFREYVPFTDYEDMVGLCKHYLAREDERRAIAAAGSEKANRFYSAGVFWESLFTRLFDRPMQSATAETRP